MAWKCTGDLRGALMGGHALLLQVAHPVIGGGVHDHSDYQRRPWERLWATLDSLNTQVYGGREALAEGARLREVHKAFKGVDHRGRRYHALNPEAYTWVHMTLYEGLVTSARVLGRPLTDRQQRDLYAEWREVGRVLGIKEHHMPADVEAFREYFDQKVATRLEPNPTVDGLLETFRGENIPRPSRYVPMPLWRLARPAVGKVLTAGALATLPDSVLGRLDLAVTPEHRRWLRLVTMFTRYVFPLLPGRVRYYPVAWKAIRASGYARAF
ncbi:oxygenase MpaB family protein [Saccharopolyspora erythraea]|uniref:oxygenase MpaB family protein n=1 Tax=Saccharopolyspora erythraea TaxID=1836 RepID=UPI00038D902F|nr:oxygenase MpaB family protein [Saccharopolyspora erythraea]EQD82195.1 hypothetical protein N599_32000 [Saccharopolyspora erythraea D]QRK92948.1 DUF2236 domain-containing protein [Saccharopolyspora erythraea]